MAKNSDSFARRPTTQDISWVLDARNESLWIYYLTAKISYLINIVRHLFLCLFDQSNPPYISKHEY